MSAKFISIEGIEGVGKSSHVQHIRDWLNKRQIANIATREPGGTEVAEAIREVLLKSYDEVVHDETELLLMYASRVQHVKNKINPALNDGKWVVCDRFLDATLAYQGGGRGLSVDHILQLHKWLLDNQMPDLTFVLDAPVEVALKRIANRSLDRIEKETQSFFERIRHQYLQLANQYPKRIKVIDASVDIKAVREQISQVLESWI
jgi:dTMP kinase